MLEKVTSYLNEKEWVYSEKGDAISFSLHGYKGIFNCVIRIHEETFFISFITYLGTRCPEEKRADMAQLLSHINSNLLFGDFEMNLFDGIIKFRTGMYYGGIELTTKIIDNVVLKNIQAMDISSIQFNKFLFGGVSIPEVYDILYPLEVSEPPKEIESEKEVKQIE